MSEPETDRPDEEIDERTDDMMDEEATAPDPVQPTFEPRRLDLGEPVAVGRHHALAPDDEDLDEGDRGAAAAPWDPAPEPAGLEPGAAEPGGLEPEVPEPAVPEPRRELAEPVMAEPAIGEQEPTAWPSEVEPAPAAASSHDGAGSRWSEIQVLFVDDPASSVVQALQAVDDELATILANLRQHQSPIAAGPDADGAVGAGPSDTERLRLALRSCRAFWEDLVSLGDDLRHAS